MTSQPPVSPLLATGMRLSRDEFERRYSAMPHIKKAELVEGVVYIPSPVRMQAHAHPHFRLGGWLNHYEAFTPGTMVADNGTVRLDTKNEPQPDAMLFIKAESGGQATISEDDYLEGAPEYVAEIAASSVGRDLTAKKTAYRRNGVREYLVWRVLDGALDWFVAKGRKFVPLVPDAAGILRSEVFPGLWLDIAALIRDDFPVILQVLQQGLASPEHEAFVKRLKKSGRPTKSHDPSRKRS